MRPIRSRSAVCLDAVGIALALTIASSGATAAAAPEPFAPNTVIDLARTLAQKPYVPPDSTLPASIGDLAYDDYQAIQFRRDLAFGREKQLPFWVELFHRGLLYKDRVDVALVRDGVATPVVYSPDLFTFGLRATEASDGDIGFSGVRLIGQLNQPGLFQEFAVFQGASYLRAIGSGQTYGLSARGLAIATDRPGSEEFPLFRKFWVEQPDPTASSIIVDALLDSPSVSGAYRFVVSAGSPTTIDVEATLFPRVDLTDIGIAPGTSMFEFDEDDRKNVDDYRPQVHDSDGLLVHQSDGKYLWRALANPRSFTVSSIAEQAPLGFGLMQRARAFTDYQDLWAHYEARPSLWVEPHGNWGDGAVTLVEIPTGSEFFDNIVAYWRPAKPIAAGAEFSFAYRMSWGGEPADAPRMFVNATRSGQALSIKPTPVRQFMVDFADRVQSPSSAASIAAVAAPIKPSVAVTTSAGIASGLLIADLPDGAGWRAGFQLDPQDAKSADLSLTLSFPDQRPAEVWTYHWAAE